MGCAKKRRPAGASSQAIGEAAVCDGVPFVGWPGFVGVADFFDVAGGCASRAVVKIACVSSSDQIGVLTAMTEGSGSKTFRNSPVLGSATKMPSLPC